MTVITEIVNALNDRIIPIFRTVVIVIVVFIVFNFLLTVIKRALLKRVKRKKHISNVEIFSRVIKYIFFVLIVLFAIFSYAGAWTGFGLTVGLLSAALGWALQRPITGMAAWLMVIIKRPFEIGDRVIIGNVKGDVADITLTHIYLREVGGIVAGEENSGRTILIPNSVLYEKNITNYTYKDEYVMDQVITAITYESNLDKAVEVCLECVKKITKEFIKITKKQPHIRTYFQPNGINLHVRYFAPASRLQEISSTLTQEIFNKIRKTKAVEIAYPHTEVVLRKKRK